MNLLATKPGRLTALGGLYLSEGLPGAFLMVAIANELNLRGMETASIGIFVSVLAFPWIFKFVLGPFVDNLHIKRLGARKQWIVTCQVGMIVAFAFAIMNMPDKVEINTDGVKGLWASMKVIFSSHIGLFALLLLLHNTLAATQDVAIDAMACRILKPDERGLGNGVMFGMYRVGEVIGGSMILKLNHRVQDFEKSSLVVMFMMVAILTCVVIFIREKSAAQQMAEGELPAPKPGDSGLTVVKDQLQDYGKTLWVSVIRVRNGFLSILLALTPIGALALTMLLSQLIAPRLGMNQNEVGDLTLYSGLIFVVFCLLGGWMSDRFNRRLMVAIGALLTIPPSLWMAAQFKEAGWAHPPNAVNGEFVRHDMLIGAWWTATLVFTAFSSFAHGAKMALYMDVVNPKVAATQFTALMALSNCTNIYSKLWQSQALDEKQWGWPIWNVLYVDAAVGVLFLIVLFFIRPESEKKNRPGYPADPTP